MRYNGPCSGGPMHDQVLDHDAERYEVASGSNILGTYVWDGYYIWVWEDANAQAGSN